MQNRFSIGEMSRLMNVPIKTLRYYDEIGLFKPVEVNRDTGYRYYSTEQFEQLDIIKYLRLLGVPLAEIAAHTARNTAKIAEELAATPTPPWLRHLAL